ncbi:MAG: lasso RiPP family leader peptide-containing protein [Acidimicrobiia bacterium]
MADPAFPQQPLRYEPPALRVIGSVEELTQGVTGTIADGLSGTPGRHSTPGPPPSVP